MDFTKRQMDIIHIISVQEKANLAAIRASLPEPISIPTLNSEIGKLIYRKVLYQIGRGRTKVYSLFPEYN
jgi:hypothetical protein